MSSDTINKPIADDERAEILDALRGFALFGILVSHIPDFSGYTFLTPDDQNRLDRFGVDEALSPILEFIIRGKFFSLFSLLFGIGFAVQLESAARRGANFALHFARRLSVLFLIGLAHAGIWYGDILKDYALIGFLLIMTARWSVARLAWAAAIVVLCRVLWPLFVGGLVPLFWSPSAGADPSGGFAELARTFEGANLIAAFSANAELAQLKALQMVYDGRALSILGMFLLGALIGRLRLYRDLDRHRPLFARVFWLCLPIGLVGNAALLPLHAAAPDFPPTPMWLAEQSVFAIAIPALTLAYASGFALLWSDTGNILRLFAPAGRMALTTYVSHSLIGIALFYGVGWGFYGGIGLLEGVALAVLIFALQIAISALWLQYFRFGPLEWLWRRATYGERVALLRATPPRLAT